MRAGECGNTNFVLKKFLIFSEILVPFGGQPLGTPQLPTDLGK